MGISSCRIWTGIGQNSLSILFSTTLVQVLQLVYDVIPLQLICFGILQSTHHIVLHYLVSRFSDPLTKTLTLSISISYFHFSFFEQMTMCMIFLEIGVRIFYDMLITVYSLPQLFIILIVSVAKSDRFMI